MKLAGRGALAALVLVAAALCPRGAQADTPLSVWERARDPAMADAESLHFTVRRLLHNAELLARAQRSHRSPFDLRLPEAVNALALRQQVIGMLERAGADESPYAPLRFDLAEALDRVGQPARAAVVLRAALAEFPGHPASDHGWWQLGIACGRTGDHACEFAAWTEVLRRRTDAVERMTPMLNFAEVLMHRGDLRDAIDHYRETFRLASHHRADGSETTAALALWGLAVALDRAGDPRGAEEQAKLVVDLERSMNHVGTLLHNDGVFFTPDYEVRWYDGLEALTLARQAKPGQAGKLWDAAVRAFSDYVKGGEAKGDRWLPIARTRLAQVAAERERWARQSAGARESAAQGDVDL